MKGGAIPFSEITEVYDNLKHSFHDAVDVFKDMHLQLFQPIQHLLM